MDADERAAHSFLVAETGFGGDDIDRVSAGLYHQSSGFQAKAFDGLGRRHASFRPERAAELPRTETSHSGQLLDRKGGLEIEPRVCERILDPIGFRMHLQKRRVL